MYRHHWAHWGSSMVHRTIDHVEYLSSIMCSMSTCAFSRWIPSSFQMDSIPFPGGFHTISIWNPGGRQTAVCSCYYIIAGGYAYAYNIAGGYVSAYVIASGCVNSPLKTYSCNTSALSAASHHIFTPCKIEKYTEIIK